MVMQIVICAVSLCDWLDIHQWLFHVCWPALAQKCLTMSHNSWPECVTELLLLWCSQTVSDKYESFMACPSRVQTGMKQPKLAGNLPGLRWAQSRKAYLAFVVCLPGITFLLWVIMHPSSSVVKQEVAYKTDQRALQRCNYHAHGYLGNCSTTWITFVFSV